MLSSSKDFWDILAALSTPAIGALAGYIAWRQWRTTEQKRKQDLFDKRYEAYEDTMAFFKIARDGQLLEKNAIRNADQKTLSPFPSQSNMEFENLLPRINFLFGEKVSQLVSDIWQYIRNDYYPEKYAYTIGKQYSSSPDDKFLMVRLQALEAAFTEPLSVGDKIVNCW